MNKEIFPDGQNMDREFKISRSKKHRSRRRGGIPFLAWIGCALLAWLAFAVSDLVAQEAPKETDGGGSAVMSAASSNPSETGDSIKTDDAPFQPVDKTRVRIEEGITFWLLDHDGKWKIPLPNWSIEDVAKSFDSFGRKNEELPYTIQSLNAVGNAEEKSVRLSIEFRINTNDDSVVRVPLGLKEGIYIPENDETGVDQNFHYDGPGSGYLDIDRQSGGYVAVIHNVPDAEASQETETDNDVTESSETSPEENLLRLLGPESDETEERFVRNRHSVKITLLFRIDSPSEDEHRLRVSFAPSVASKIRLDVPLPDIQLTASEGTVASPPVNLNETTSEITLTGLSRTGAPTELIWRKKESHVSEIPLILQVENGVIAVHPDEQGIQYDVTLPIRSYGESLNLIRVRLPADTHPIGESIQAVGRDNGQLGIRWEEKPLIDETENQSASDRTVLEIHLTQPSDFVTLHFKATARSGQDGSEMENEATEGASEWECVGFDVIGAQRQSGRLSVQIPDGTDFDLIPEKGVRNSTFVPENGDEKTEFFTFFTQPFSLKAKPIRREARVSVVPEYQILVQDGQIKMTAHYHYSVHEAPLRHLRLKTAGWFINEFDKDGPIDADKIYLNPETEELTLPLKSATDGDIDVKWSAVREFKLNQDILEIPIPAVLADWVDPAIVTIIPDDHIELVPLPGRFIDLAQKRQRSLHLTIDPPKRQQPPLVYQAGRTSKEGTEKNPRFAAKVVLHEQKIRVGSETTVTLLNQPNDAIRQTLRYMIDYVPLKTISIVVPSELRDNPDLTINVDGKPVSPRNVLTEPSGDAEPDTFRKQIHLPDDGVIGQCELTLQYPVGKIELLPQRTNHIPLDLTVPEDGTFETNRLTVKTLPGIQIFQPETSMKAWVMEEGKSDETLNRRDYHFTARQRERQIALRAIVKGEGALGATVIERLWVQTWLNEESRFERIACRVVSNQDSFFIRLPGPVRQDQLEIKLDGVPYFDENSNSEVLDSENRIEIRPSALQKKKIMTLEISYLIPLLPERFGERLAFPEFGDPSVWIRRCYWQVILPENRHLFGEPDKWTAEFYDLTWGGFFFRRVASMGAEELGTWVGTSSVEEIPQDANVYLFSSFDPPKSCRLKIVDRALLVLFGSGCFLAFGLVFVYCPRLRYGEVILLILILSVAIFLFRPVVVLVYLQTSVIGVVLTIFAYVFKRFLGHKAGSLPVSREISDIREIPAVSEESTSSKSSHMAEEK